MFIYSIKDVLAVAVIMSIFAVFLSARIALFVADKWPHRNSEMAVFWIIAGTALAAQFGLIIWGAIKWVGH